MVIPAELRRELGLEPGETLMAHVESRRIVIERRDEILERLRAEVRGTRRDTSAVDELIAERRAEARREAAEDERRA